MLNEVSRKNLSVIRKKAEQVLKSTNNVVPTNLKLIIEHYNFDIYTLLPELRDFEGLDGLVDLEDEIILFNPNDPYVRRRFTIAHELGHIFLNHKYLVGQISDFNSNDIKEVEANLFAAELLIPFSNLKADLKSGLKVPEIAKKYVVSELAVGWRLSRSDALLFLR